MTTKNTQFLRSGNLFSMIVQTNLSSTQLETIPAIQQPQTATAAATTATEPASINEITNKTDAVELSFSELTAKSLDNQRIKVVVKAKKIVSNQLNTISINQNNSRAYTINQFSNESFIYTDSNANELYRTITGNDTVEPFTFLSSNTQVKFYATTPGSDQIYIQTFTFKKNKKKLQMLITNKQDISMWKGAPPDRQVNWQKIMPIFNIPENRRNFRRIVKLMATILAREVGYFGSSRYSGNKAYTQLEYSAVCWAIINMAKKRGFGSEGDIIKLFDTEYTLNVTDDEGNKLEQSSPKKLIKTLQAGETEEDMIKRENNNILTHQRGYKNDTQNLELYVMAFFDGLINEEFPGGSNWSHVRTDNNVTPNENFEITPFRIHRPVSYNNLTYPRYVVDGDGPSTYGNDASYEKFSNGPVYTVAGGNPLVLISIN